MKPCEFRSSVKGLDLTYEQLLQRLITACATECADSLREKLKTEPLSERMLREHLERTQVWLDTAAQSVNIKLPPNIFKKMTRRYFQRLALAAAVAAAELKTRRKP